MSQHFTPCSAGGVLFAPSCREFFCAKRQNQVYYYYFLPLLSFSLTGNRFIAQSLWLSCAWHASLGPACLICFCIYIAVDTLTSFSQIARDIFSSYLATGPWRAGILWGYIKVCVRELKGKCFFGPSFSLDITYYSPFLLSLLTGETSIMSFLWRTYLVTWYMVVVSLNWGIIVWYIVPHELDEFFVNCSLDKRVWEG